MSSLGRPAARPSRETGAPGLPMGREPPCSPRRMAASAPVQRPAAACRECAQASPSGCRTTQSATLLLPQTLCSLLLACPLPWTPLLTGQLPAGRTTHGRRALRAGEGATKWGLPDGKLAAICSPCNSDESLQFARKVQGSSSRAGLPEQGATAGAAALTLHVLRRSLRSDLRNAPFVCRLKVGMAAAGRG